MKRFKQMLAVLLCAVALCGLAPAALAAQPLDESENGGKVIIYFETCGGTGIPVVERTSGDGKLYSLPTPTMEGYTFKGWDTDIVGGDAIVAGETEFSGEDATIYAQWDPIDQPVTEEPMAPADSAEGIWERHKATILIVGGVLLLAAAGLVM